MRRIAILIGAPDEGDDFLHGVEVDLKNYSNHLLGNSGGKWKQNEIVSLYDQPLSEIQGTIKTIKNGRYDFAFVVFTGHGSYSTQNRCRRLFIRDDQWLLEKDLWGISEKQILIIDTCAGIESNSELFLEDMRRDVVAFASQRNYRLIYENEIRECQPQTVRLYACDVDESSADTSKGGLYSSSLLQVAKNCHSRTNVLRVHNDCVPLVKEESENEQNPQYYSSCKHGPKLPFVIS